MFARRAAQHKCVRRSGAAVGLGAVAVLLLGTLEPLFAQASVDSTVLEAERQRIEVIERVTPSVVAVFGSGANLGSGGGSGVLISSDGYALTNFHVVQPAGAFMKCGLADGVLYDTVLVGIDPTGDVALIKLLGRDDFPHAVMGDSDALRVGDPAYVMGNPFLLATDFKPTVTYGIVSGVHRYQYPAGSILEYADCIQVDSSINPGNSGGPLFNGQGELVGINGRGSFEKRGRVNVGAGYAISINQIQNFLDHLRSGRIVDHATLGAAVRTSGDGSVVVTQILESSEAFRRGLRLGDEVVDFAGRSIRSVNQFKNVLGIYPKGWVVPLTYRRGDEKHTIFVRLSGLHQESEFAAAGRPVIPHGDQPHPHDDDPDDKKPEDDGKTPDGEKSDQSPDKPDDGTPESVRKLYEARAGFANYYFNRLERDRTLAALPDRALFTKLGDVWQISGKRDDASGFELTLSDQGIGLDLGDEVYLQPLVDSDPADEPAGTGGLLIALHHLKLLLGQGPDGFTECYYLGSEPLDGAGPVVDVVITELTGVESRWYFSREPTALVGFDTQLHPGIDACQLRFGPFRSFSGVSFPAEWERRLAGEKQAAYNVEEIRAVSPTGAGDPRAAEKTPQPAIQKEP